MNASRAVKDYLFTNYGHLIQADEPVFDDSRKSYVARLYSSYPITIRDDRGHRRSVRYIDVPYLGEIVLSAKLLPLQADTTTRDQLNGKLSEFLRIWTEAAENLVLSATAGSIVKLPIVPVVLNPVKIIIDQLWNHERIRDVEIGLAHSKTKATRYRKYLELLEGINIVRRHESSWLPGENFTKVQTQVRKLEEARDVLFSMILRKRYGALKQVFDIGNLERVIKIENAVYLPEVEEGRSLFRDVQSIGTDFYRFYGEYVNHLDIESMLGDLTRVGVIVNEDAFFAGSDSIRRDIVSSRDKEPSVQSRWCTAYG